MKIGLLGPTYPFRGGIAHYNALLFRNLKKKHDVKFISFTRQYPKIIFPGETDRDLSKAPLSEEGVQYLLDSMNPYTWWKVAREFIRFKPDILIIPWWVTFWAPQFWFISTLVKRNRHTKILFLCHNVIPHEAGYLNRFGRKITLGRGDYFIVHSEEEAIQLGRLLPGCNVKRTFHPTYDEFNINPDTCEREPKEPYSILFFGFVRKYKGLDHLIRAVSELKGRLAFKLTVAGEFWDGRSQYDELIDSLDLNDAVELIDQYVPNEQLEKYFCNSDIVVLPYVSVTGSGAVQLALGFNKPVITSGIGSLKEVVIDGFNGFTVPPKDPKAIADSIIKALEPKTYEELLDNIKGDRHRFSWDKMVETIESFCAE